MIAAQLSGKQCRVCGEAAVPVLTGAFSAPVCKDLECRTVVGKQETMPAFHYQCFFATQSQRIRSARRAKKAELERREQELLGRRKIKAAIEAADKAVWQEKIPSIITAQTALDLDTVSVANLAVEPFIIPRGPREVVAASAERHEIHAGYLAAIIQEMDSEEGLECIKVLSDTTGQHSDPELPNEAQISPSLAIGLCTVCAGGCCTKGGNAAYLTAHTMRRVRADSPDISLQDLQQLYLARLPTESMAGSCIYHTTLGCALPRELRSDTCNDYACEALKSLPITSADVDTASTNVLVFQRRQDKWRQNAVDLDNKIVAAYLLSDDETKLLDELL